MRARTRHPRTDDCQVGRELRAQHHVQPRGDEERAHAGGNVRQGGHAAGQQRAVAHLLQQLERQLRHGHREGEQRGNGWEHGPRAHEEGRNGCWRRQGRRGGGGVGVHLLARSAEKGRDSWHAALGRGETPGTQRWEGVRLLGLVVQGLVCMCTVATNHATAAKGKQIKITIMFFSPFSLFQVFHTHTGCSQAPKSFFLLWSHTAPVTH